MADLMSKIPIFDHVNKQLKDVIKSIYVFHDDKGVNALFTAIDDNVFGYGYNRWGVCGLGHNNVVTVPQIIPELCHKSVQQFYNGYSFALALTGDNALYGWGCNRLGQLGIGFTSGNEMLKPVLIKQFNDVVIKQISCGSAHTLMLTSDGVLYCWGYNNWGQIGCGTVGGDMVPEIIRLNGLPEIQSIHCSFSLSFAVTTNGVVYSWGQNSRYGLDHKFSENCFEPKIIENLPKIVSICGTYHITYFLTKGDSIYFCGKHFTSKLLGLWRKQKLPRLIDSKYDFQSIACVQWIYKQNQFEPNCCALREDGVYRLTDSKAFKTDFRTIQEYYVQTYQVTFGTIDLYNPRLLRRINSTFNKSLNNNNNEHQELSIKLSNDFDDAVEIGHGGFGKVYQCKNKLDDKVYAIKVIDLNDIDKDLALREVKTLSSLRSNRVVQYYNSWSVDSRLYIQMELCSDNLKNILTTKQSVFGRTSSEERMTRLEYYISCQLFIEILQCVQYLHELKPPLIHRDLKPANILFTEHGMNGRFIKLCDLGLALFQDVNTMQTCKHAGTLKYMAPEVLTAGTYDWRSDIYSLSIIGQELFEFDVNNSTSVSHGELGEKYNRLEQILLSMGQTRYKERPSCISVIETLGMWSIGLDSIAIPENIQDKRLINNSLAKFVYFHMKIL